MDADPTQLNQLIVNLCINAGEAMPAGGTLAVGTRDVHAGRDDLRALGPGSQGRTFGLTVADSGVGMTDEMRQRIFEPFFTTKSGGTASGTGLGLPTVYGVVHLHRGAIKVDYRRPAKAPLSRCSCRRGALAVPAVTPEAAAARRQRAGPGRGRRSHAASAGHDRPDASRVSHS